MNTLVSAFFLSFTLSIAGAHPNHGHRRDDLHHPHSSSSSDVLLTSINPGGPIMSASSIVTASPTTSSLPLSGILPPIQNISTSSRTEIVIPIATLCAPTTAGMTITANATGPVATAAVSADNASAMYANATAFSNSTGSTLTESGADGCSTLYTAATASQCHTTLSGMGQIPITVTDCSQYVTFSTSTETATTSASGAPMGDNVAYFLAPWQVIAAGGVPTNVTVEDCTDGSGGQYCTTSSETWSLTTKTSDVAVTETVSFQGTVTGPAVLTLGSGIYTTSIPDSTTEAVSIDTVITTSTPSPYVSITRLTSEELTTTVTVRQTVTSTVGVSTM